MYIILMYMKWYIIEHEQWYVLSQMSEKSLFPVKPAMETAFDHLFWGRIPSSATIFVISWVNLKYIYVYIYISVLSILLLLMAQQLGARTSADTMMPLFGSSKCWWPALKELAPVLWCCNQNIPGQIVSPGSMCCQVISSHGIECIGGVDPSIILVRDIKYLCHFSVEE